MITSYGKICNISDASLIGPRGLFNGEVIVEEKIDGSQYNFCISDGEIKARSKSTELKIDAPEKMFSEAINSVKELAPLLRPNWIYRGEYLRKPRHNALIYDRIPNKYIILFDITDENGKYLSYEDKLSEANRLGLEVVPLIYRGNDFDINNIKNLIDRYSCLGNVKIEGVVIKNYNCDGRVLMGKYVSDAFKEVHRKDFKKENATSKDIIMLLSEAYGTVARWQKALQHLEEKGQLLHESKDIGSIIKEVQLDIEEECKEDIKNHLYDWAKPYLMKSIIKNIPDWYKNKLIEEKLGTSLDSSIETL